MDRSLVHQLLIYRMRIVMALILWLMPWSGSGTLLSQNLKVSIFFMNNATLG